MASDILREHDATLVLVDTNEERLRKAGAIAELIRRYHGSETRIEMSTDRREALPGADFVIISVAVKRYELWEQDYRVPRAFGFRQVLGENGGPGALFHTLRNLKLVIPICRDIEEISPDALALNYTNPESRIIMGISKLTGLTSVGLCHGVPGTLRRIGDLLGRDPSELRIVTGGLNHFFWVLRIEDADGADLYPLLRERARDDSPPLAREMLERFGYYIFPSDDHIGEYLPFAHEFIQPMWPYGRERSSVPSSPSSLDDPWDEYISGSRAVDEELVRRSGELGVEIIENVVGNGHGLVSAVNVPNTEGFIENLPRDAVVEVPAMVSSVGPCPVSVGSLPENLAALCRRQIDVQRLIVDAYERRSREVLLQALLLDPVVDGMGRAERMLDYMLDLQAEYLPRFS
jgi:alpha-galactosidase